MNDIIINKIQSIQKCVDRAREEYQAGGTNFSCDYSRQDAAVLNIMRACETAIDLANHLTRKYKMGIPNTSREGFELLMKKQVISDALCRKMSAMTGFRNIAVHTYQRLNVSVVIEIIAVGLNDFLEFTDAVAEFVNKKGEKS
ncbi:MAG: toxin-antitoxin antitoxin component [Desulfobacteraceae bacterium IS3]|jgi:uncharacterized protein YutE (UPF0331/DUF86 family)|nr:MAG: toxin-antitoxin antitoxin component [Desulfobacteraceae bacterium IS3]HAO22802.1 toxin-antitoxin antitoxin component [Desulfobacteraceae bacterium]